MRFGAVLVIAKEPVPGRVKTRLVPPCTAAEAAEVATAALADTLAEMATVPAAEHVVVLDGAPGPWLPAGWRVVPQCPGGLDVRLADAFGQVGGPAMLVGMDTPQLRAEQVTAFDPDRFDAALGLSADGGYWAIGFRAPADAARTIPGVPMSAGHTGAVQTERLRAANLSVQLLDTLVDVDTADSAAEVAAAAPAVAIRGGVVGAGQPGRPVIDSALEPYEAALRERLPLALATPAGAVIDLDIERYLAPADDVDAEVLLRCRGPVLDVGCGPGRMVRALTELGVCALGVDIAPTAIGLSRSRGAAALQRDVFDRMPGEGRWPTVLVLDGNVGIGGDVDRLLGRLAELLGPGGRVIVETHLDADVEQFLEVCFHRAGQALGAPFPWAVVGADVLCRRAAAAGLVPTERWVSAGRSFVELSAALG